MRIILYHVGMLHADRGGAHCCYFLRKLNRLKHFRCSSSYCIRLSCFPPSRVFFEVVCIIFWNFFYSMFIIWSIVFPCDVYSFILISKKVSIIDLKARMSMSSQHTFNLNTAHTSSHSYLMIAIDRSTVNNFIYSHGISNARVSEYIMVSVL